ncbi:helix-turn-helix domain-containing protein [Sphingopyxis sp. 113P3]|uniref:helix-turn-helix domain-containing protein n=1 Tax=Sphingopyxis sp. (strain 113P3) TaxID=292913 RepID=UPI0006AD2AF3|nr:helix-turn-helix transcriptional regulator [Sphingopyxis sp. 113P3]
MEQQHPLDSLFASAKANRIPMSRVCERAGVDPTTPSRWKRGLTRPTADKLFELQKALAVLVEEREAEIAAVSN